MIKEFIKYLKTIDVFEDISEGAESFETEIEFNAYFFHMDFNLLKQRVKVVVWQEIDEDWIETKINPDELQMLVDFLETLAPEQEEEPITDYYSYYGVQPQYFI